MKKIRITLALLASFAIAGCASNGSSSAAVNTKCPMNGEMADQAVTTEYNGHTVAFCCSKCVTAWGNLDDSQKQAKLEGAMPQK